MRAVCLLRLPQKSVQKSVLNLSSCFLFVCVGVWWEVREVGVHVEVSYVVVVKSRVYTQGL